MRGNYYTARNVAGQDVILDVRDKHGNLQEFVIPNGETLEGLNEHAMKFLWRYVWMGLIKVDTEWDAACKPNWMKEGF